MTSVDEEPAIANSVFAAPLAQVGERGADGTGGKAPMSAHSNTVTGCVFSGGLADDPIRERPGIFEMERYYRENFSEKFVPFRDGGAVKGAVLDACA